MEPRSARDADANAVLASSGMTARPSSSLTSPVPPRAASLTSKSGGTFASPVDERAVTPADSIGGGSVDTSSSSRTSRRRSMVQTPSAISHSAVTRNESSFEDAEDDSLETSEAAEDSILASRRTTLGRNSGLGHLDTTNLTHDEEDGQLSARESIRRRRFDGRDTAENSNEHARRTSRRHDRTRVDAAEGAPSQLSFPQATKSPLRAPMPLEFRPAAPTSSSESVNKAPVRSGSRTSSYASNNSPRMNASPLLPSKNSFGSVNEDENHNFSTARRERAGRLRENSDPTAIPDFDYEGRGGTRGARLSVDSSSAVKHLSAGRSHASPSLERGEGTSIRAEGESFAEWRARKTSGSSSISQRSGGSGDGANRVASLRRAGKLNGQGYAEDIPPVPTTTTYRSPKTSLSSSNSERMEELRTRKELFRNGHPQNRSDTWSSSRTSELLSSRPASRGPSVSGVSDMSNRSLTQPRSARLGMGSDGMSVNGRTSVAMTGQEARYNQRSFTSMGTHEPPRTPDIHGTWRVPGSGRKFGAVDTSGYASSSRRSSAATSQRLQEVANVEQPLHAKNLSEVLEQFALHYTSSSSARALADAGDTETQDMVQHIEEFGDLAVTINSTVRELLQHTLQAQIDAEMNSSTSDLQAWSHMDKSLVALLRTSDDQIRSVTSGLYSLMRADKERDRLRRHLDSDAGSVGRPGSRLSGMHISPSKHALIERRETIATTRTSPRKNGHTRTESRLMGRRPASRLAQGGPSPTPQAESEENMYAYESPLSPSDPAARRLRLGGPTHARSASEATTRMAPRSPKRTDSTRTSKAPPSLSPKRASLSMAAVSRGELTQMLDHDSHAPPSAPMPSLEWTEDAERSDSRASRRNTISSVASLGRGSGLTVKNGGYSPRGSLQLSPNVSPNQDSGSSISRIVSQSLSRTSGRRTSRLFAERAAPESTY